jgi:hypothetical protein
MAAIIKFAAVALFAAVKDLEPSVNATGVPIAIR